MPLENLLMHCYLKIELVCPCQYWYQIQMDIPIMYITSLWILCRLQLPCIWSDYKPFSHLMVKIPMKISFQFNVYITGWWCEAVGFVSFFLPCQLAGVVKGPSQLFEKSLGRRPWKYVWSFQGSGRGCHNLLIWPHAVTVIKPCIKKYWI